ncbi:hypothetical protein GCM10022207_29660 [Streptomyces lannensis]|uniref:Uncharacterized protein n=1 Tax=Streptomyces lannensis TaxID=766498 RepID=A0ABP7K2I4_9ACTN
MTSRQQTPRSTVANTDHIEAASAGAAGNRRLMAISLGVENARLAMRTVTMTGDSSADPRRLAR